VSRRYISIPEAAEYLGISTEFVRSLITEGEIKGYRIGSYARHRRPRPARPPLEGEVHVFKHNSQCNVRNCGRHGV
jgi:excisionase family DNA binding protein